MKKLINFKQMQVVRDIQDYANSNFDGNFTEAVVRLCKLSLALKANKEKGDAHLQDDLLK